jgi:hypothetical protein
MIDLPKSDLSRAVSHETNEQWPESVKIQLLWRDQDGRPIVRTEFISSDQFFGHGSYGAPLSGEWLINYIERMRRAGPPAKVRRAFKKEKR